MTDRDLVTCADFDAAVDDLARGMVSEPRRADLLGHATTCERCESFLADLIAVVDRLLHFAPEAEPPLGFETRAVATMASQPIATRHQRRRWPVAAAAAAVVVGLVIGLAVGQSTAPDGQELTAGPIVTESGRRIGEAELAASPRPRIVLTMDEARSGGRRWSCELLAADGRWVEIGTWTGDEAVNGVWAAGIDAELADATRMRILGAEGNVIAHATLR